MEMGPQTEQEQGMETRLADAESMRTDQSHVCGEAAFVSLIPTNQNHLDRNPDPTHLPALRHFDQDK